MTPTQRQYFDNMQPGETLHTTQARNPADLITAAKEYIDQTGLLVFDDNFTQVTKLHPFPTNGEISFYFE